MKAKGNCNTSASTLAMGVVLVLLFHFFGSAVAAPVRSSFTYQGRLSDSAGPVSGRYDFVFGLHLLPSGGAAVINVTNFNTGISNGLFTAAIDFGPVFTGTNYWLQIRLRTNGSTGLFTTLLPHQPLMAMPNADFAALAESIPNHSIEAQKLSAGPAADGQVLVYSGGNLMWTNVLMGTNVPGLADCWKLLGNGGTTAGVNFFGTTDNQPLELKVNGQRVFRLVPTSNAPTIIGGFAGNFVTTEAVGVTISGGGAQNMSNIVDSVYFRDIFDYDHLVPNFASIGGGATNRIQGGEYSMIAGGIGNWIYAYRAEDGRQNTIAGGGNNDIYTASYSSINGGQRNRVSGTSNYRIRYGTIGGGGSNALDFSGWYSTIGGGSRNTIGRDTYFGTVKGGRNNLIVLSEGNEGTIGGGSDNSIHDKDGTIGGGSGNFLYGFGSTIAGGTRNRTDGFWQYGQTIGGGSSNTTKGIGYGTIPGGRENVAFDDCFSAGRRAKATNTGAFVWADSSDFAFGSIAANEFAVRATGGVRFVTGLDDGGAPVAGATLTAGSGSWSSLSDRAAKENFAPANAREILDKVASLPVSTWNYKTQDKSIHHIGPTAQDFHAAFGVGENDRTISTIDADGVALAAIQALNQKLEEKEARIDEVERRLIALEKALSQRRK